jgi:hypothetical protein
MKDLVQTAAEPAASVGSVIDPAWQLVPKEPTYEMELAGEKYLANLEAQRIMAGADLGSEDYEPNAKDVYGAMLSASPTPPETQWQPIETAPKDCVAVFWLERADGVQEDWTPSQGYALCKKGGWTAVCKATHWMPLPPSPDDRTNDTVAQSESLKQTPSLSASGGENG